MTRKREPDYEDKAEAYRERQRKRWFGCLCGYPDLPGYCPGARACPMHGETMETEE